MKKKENKGLNPTLSKGEGAGSAGNRNDMQKRENIKKSGERSRKSETKGQRTPLNLPEVNSGQALEGTSLESTPGENKILPEVTPSGAGDKHPEHATTDGKCQGFQPVIRIPIAGCRWWLN